jgi:hypothetical protein
MASLRAHRIDALTTVNSRYEADDNRPYAGQEICGEAIDHGWEASNILVDIISMTLDKKLW